jgi:hypothetical protein
MSLVVGQAPIRTGADLPVRTIRFPIFRRVHEALIAFRRWVD